MTDNLNTEEEEESAVTTVPPEPGLVHAQMLQRLYLHQRWPYVQLKTLQAFLNRFRL